MHSPMRRTILTVVKLLLAAAILVYLVFKGRDAFAQLSAKTIDWPMLVAALFCTLLMAALSYLRWHILIRALGIDARLIDSMRLGSLGFRPEFRVAGLDRRRFFQSNFFGTRPSGPADRSHCNGGGRSRDGAVDHDAAGVGRHFGGRLVEHRFAESQDSVSR